MAVRFMLVEVELLHELHEDGRGHQLEPIALGRPDAHAVVVVPPVVDVAQDHAVDQADHAPRSPAPVEGVVDGLAPGMTDGPHHPAGAVVGVAGIVDPGDPAPVVIEGRREPAVAADGRFTRIETLPEELFAPAVAGDSPDSGDRYGSIGGQRFPCPRGPHTHLSPPLALLIECDSPATLSTGGPRVGAELFGVKM